MPNPTQWSTEGISRFLADYGLAAPVSARVLEGGCDNLNLLLDVGDEKLVLRRYRRTGAEEVAWELELIRLLAERGFPTPPVLRSLEGGLAGSFLGGTAALFRYLPGAEAEPRSLDNAVQTAALIADLHLATRGLEIPHPRTRTDLQLLADLEEMASSLDSPGLAEMAAEARSFREEFTARLAAGPAIPWGIVHHDPNPGNVLVNDEGKVVALLDFDLAHSSHLLTDVAATIRCWSTRPDCSLNTEWAARQVAAYHARRPLSEREWDLLPDFVLLYYLADAAGYVTDTLQSEELWRGA
jgi:homoserine kinase type II